MYAAYPIGARSADPTRSGCGSLTQRMMTLRLSPDVRLAGRSVILRPLLSSSETPLKIREPGRLINSRCDAGTAVLHLVIDPAPSAASVGYSWSRKPTFP